jgi:hypothetical protein
MDLREIRLRPTDPARSLQPDLNVVLRIFDRDIAEEIRKNLPVSAALSASAISSAMLMEPRS